MINRHNRQSTIMFWMAFFFVKSITLCKLHFILLPVYCLHNITFSHILLQSVHLYHLSLFTWQNGVGPICSHEILTRHLDFPLQTPNPVIKTFQSLSWKVNKDCPTCTIGKNYLYYFALLQLTNNSDPLSYLARLLLNLYYIIALIKTST